jgi:spermidine synthase
VKLSSRSTRWTLSALAFASGFGTLVLELAGARLLAGTYGLSSLPWTAVIAAVLSGLAIGNTLGGIAADRGLLRVPDLFFAAGLWTAIPLLGGEAIPATFARDFGFLPGAVGTALVFFLVPSALMGAVTPILVERQTRVVEEVGLRYGNVGAWGTVGALAGSLGAGVVLLPSLPLRSVLGITCCAFLAAATLSALLEEARWRVGLSLAMVPLALLLSRPPSLGANILYSGQSLYASLRVVDADWFDDVPVRELWQNGSLSSAEHRVTGEPTQFYKIAVAYLMAGRAERLDSVLVLGGAANTLPTQLKRTDPGVHVTVVEIDPLAVELAREFFSYGQLAPEAIEMRLGDARPFLARESRRYDVVMVDAYDNLYSVPWPLVTREAINAVAERLRPGGMMTLTLSTPLEGPGAAFLRRVVTTVGEVFPRVRIYPARPEFGFEATQEVIVVAARRDADFPVVDWPWLEVAGEGPALRDDFAPVEFLQALRFLHDPAW